MVPGAPPIRRKKAKRKARLLQRVSKPRQKTTADLQVGRHLEGKGVTYGAVAKKPLDSEMRTSPKELGTTSGSSLALDSTLQSSFLRLVKSHPEMQETE